MKNRVKPETVSTRRYRRHVSKL